MGDPAISYAPRPDATPEAELDTLASVYEFILDCHVTKKAGGSNAGHEEKGTKHDLPVSASLLRQ